MNDTLISLAADAAKATISAATRLGGGAAWRTISERIARLWGPPDEEPQAAELRTAATGLPGRLRPGSPGAAEVTTEELARWAARYSELLQRRPGTADSLRTLIGDINQATEDNRSNGDATAVMTGRAVWNKQIVLGSYGTYIKSSTVGATAILLLVAALVIYLVVRPDHVDEDKPAPAAAATVKPALADSCGAGLPPAAEPANGADDTATRQSYSYKVGSASGDGRDIVPGGSIRQAFVAGRPYLSQVSAIVGVADERPHPIGFQVTTLDGRVLVDAVENETPANNNKDVVYNIRPAVKVGVRDVLLLIVTNKSGERVRFFVDPPIANQVPVEYAACITGQAEMPARHADLRGHILAGSVTAQDLA
ncbi:hypothetical protein AB0J80_11855 [Actinoplanes sp. NPDC049548]|uniref:hypothetical protein n=1 Tax=Actinoplanes sp. NPDC049548 TaxID=3155152 RepID=UPI0034247A4F